MDFFLDFLVHFWLDGKLLKFKYHCISTCLNTTVQFLIDVTVLQACRGLSFGCQLYRKIPQGWDHVGKLAYPFPKQYSKRFLLFLNYFVEIKGSLSFFPCALEPETYPYTAPRGRVALNQGSGTFNMFSTAGRRPFQPFWPRTERVSVGLSVDRHQQDGNLSLNLNLQTLFGGGGIYRCSNFLLAKYG